eukprot:1218051-Rhodomonas_salina.3
MGGRSEAMGGRSEAMGGRSESATVFLGLGSRCGLMSAKRSGEGRTGWPVGLAASSCNDPSSSASESVKHSERVSLTARRQRMRDSTAMRQRKRIGKSQDRTWCSR